MAWCLCGSNFSPIGFASVSAFFSKAETSCFRVSSTPALKLSTDLLGHRQRSFEAVLDREQFAGEFLDGELVRLGNVLLGAAPDVFAFRLGTQPGVVMFGCLQFEPAKLFFDAGQGVGVLGGRRFGARFGGGFVAQQGFLGVFRVGHARFSKKVVRYFGDVPWYFKGFLQKIRRGMGDDRHANSVLR